MEYCKQRVTVFTVRRRKRVMVTVMVTVMAMVMGCVIFWPRAPLHLEPPAGPHPLPLEVGEPAAGGVLLLEGHGGASLTYRMLCTVESAARTHPDLPVTLLMTSPVVRDTALLRELTAALGNLRLLHLDAPRLFHGTPLEPWHARRGWEESSWPSSHYNDALRWLLLWHYGGIYLDLDVVVLRPLSALPNCTGLESGRWAAAGVLKFTPAHPVIGACLESFAAHFDGKTWGASGPELLTQVLKERCDLEMPAGRVPRCPDVTVFPPRVFYPVPWWEWQRYVTNDPELTRDLLSDLEVLTLHVWNHHLSYSEVRLDSQQPYARAAHARCPATVAHAGDLM